MAKPHTHTCFPLYVCSKEIIRRYTVALEPMGITYTQYLVLDCLEDQELTVSEIGNELFLDSGTLTPLLKKLEAKGLIVRTKATYDERVILVKATQEGLELYKKCAHVPDEVSAGIDFTEKDIETLREILERLAGKIVKR